MSGSVAAGVRISAGVVLAVTLVAGSSAAAAGPAGPAEPAGGARTRTGNAIFLHVDGTGVNDWDLARAYWAGPDGALAWDRMPDTAQYRGHMADVLTGTSNGAATTHAFGFKVSGAGSFGTDGGGTPAPPTGRAIDALSGYPGSIMREAANSGRPVGVVNDGPVSEPGTGAFLAEVGDRAAATEISRQLVLGRPGSDDTPPQVILGGGEADFLPRNTPRCAADRISPDCGVHGVPGLDPRAPTGNRTDGLNLIRRATELGYAVVRTRAQFDELSRQLASHPGLAPKVLGLFAAKDVFNGVPEELFTRNGFVDPSIPADDKRSNLILWGDAPGTPGYNPPTFAEMTRLASTILDRVAAAAGRPFLLVENVESTDDFGNNNNAVGVLDALKRADDTIAAVRRYLSHRPDTLLLTAADSDAGGMQALAFPDRSAPATVGTAETNPTGDPAETVAEPLDGLTGRNTRPFRTAADQFGATHEFAVQWGGTSDMAGGILARAEGRNAALLHTAFAARFDNIDVYRLLYQTLFGKALSYPDGRRAPTR